MKPTRATPWLLTGAFLFIVLLINFQIFTQPIVEDGDYAANSLLVEQAKHFQLLTGHYSRWRFQHPGPAFLYLFALGEFVFYDVLHIVPAPYNGQLLITIILNGLLLAITLAVFRRHAQLPVPLALLITGVVTVMVNTSGAPSMLVSNWMPDVLLFPFLLFAVSAASILAGESRHLPLLAFSGMLLIHAHFAQFLFVGLIGGGTVAYVLARAKRQGNLRRLVVNRWRDFAWAAVIVLIFAAPPLFELVRDRPNNLDAVRAYLDKSGSVHRNLGTAIGYFVCFLFFIGRPEIALNRGPAGILGMGLSPAPVLCYWLAAGLLLLMLVNGRKTVQAPASSGTFLKYLTGVGAASVVLFLYWGTRISGVFFAFNGYFIYAVHLLGWFVLFTAIAMGMDWRTIRRVNALALASLLILTISERQAFRALVESQPDDQQAAAAAPSAPFGSLALSFDPNQWTRAAGVAIAMVRMHKAFCVNPYWAFLFSKPTACPDLPATDQLRVTAAGLPCESPCRTIFGDADFSLMRIPPQEVHLPLEIGMRDWHGLERGGFNEDEAEYCWTQKHASIWFKLSPDSPAGCVQVDLTGMALPGRPMQLRINEQLVGTVSNGALGTATFRIPRATLHPGGSNRIDLDTENAGPIGNDSRVIGFDFVKLVLRAASPVETCR